MFKKVSDVNVKMVVHTENGVYKNGGSHRSILTVCWDGHGQRKAVAIGINPSKANDQRSDNTITRLARYLDMYGFCQFKMLNLYESYSTDQKGIIKTSETDFSLYEKEFADADAIFIVWGLSSQYIEQKKAAIQILAKYSEKLYCLKNQTGRFPIHPSRMAYNVTIIPFK